MTCSCNVLTLSGVVTFKASILCWLSVSLENLSRFQLVPTYSILHSEKAETRHRYAHMKAPMSPLADLQICCAGPLYNNEGVLLHVGATIIWSDGRRANFQCGFDQALTQYLEVCMQTADAHCHSM